MKMSNFEKIFPTDITARQWVGFSAQGYSRPVIGSIHRKEYPAVSGMPLGGIGTGCIDLETSGLFGYYTIFNSHVPRGGPMNYPFLGVSVGKKTWVLTTRATKKYFDTAGLQGTESAVHEWSKPDYVPPDMSLEGTEEIKDILYWGHYPIVDLEYEMDAPVSVGMRTWSSFIPGDDEASTIPGAVFEVHLRNISGEKQQGTIAFSFSGPERFEAGCREMKRETLSGKVTGRHVYGRYSGYAVGVIDEIDVRLGGGLYNNGTAWSVISSQLPEEKESEFGATAAVDFDLSSGKTRIVRFVMTWYSPRWLGRGTLDDNVAYIGIGNNLDGFSGKRDRMPASSNFYRNIYATIYKSAADAALTLGERHEELLARIISWQQEIYTAPELPDWLKDALINILHLITEDGMWAAAEYPVGEWCRKEDGLFGMIECPRGCPQIECIPCSFYGNIPLVYFFPRAALSTLKAYKAYQFSDGAAPWIFGGVTDNTGPVEMVYPTPGYQTTLNGPCYVDMVDRVWKCLGDDSIVQEFYQSVKKNTIFTMNLRPEYEVGDGIISMPSGNIGSEWFETEQPGWCGMVTHIGGIHLANLLMVERMAKTVGDQDFARQCRGWFEAGSRSMQEKLWTGKYYLNYFEPETGKKSDYIFAYQLDGEWMANFHGIYGVFPSENIKKTLDTIRKTNAAVTKYGAANYTNSNGTPAEVGGYGKYSMFPPELLMLSMTYMYHGEKDFGLELAYRCWNNIVNRQGLAWDQPNIFRGDKDTGERVFGADYYQNMMLWALPAALMNTDISGVTGEDGLVERVIKAGKRLIC